MTFVQILRRVHMYLALFLSPWVVMYGLSTVFMNHMPFFAGLYGKDWGAFVVERQTTYDGPLPVSPAPQVAGTNTPDQTSPSTALDASAAAGQILKHLHMDGAHWVDASRDGSRITIHRNDVLVPRQIIFTPADRKLLIKRQTFHLPLLLRRLHARRAYGAPYMADNVWAFVVDLFIVSMLLWGATGLWMGYKLKPTRRWGTLCAAAGCALFVFFLLAI
jgi:hypothetical protein